MKVRILLDPDSPKVPYKDVKTIVDSVDQKGRSPDFAIGVVVGGDGVFGRFGGSESVPLLFVGVRSKKPTGTKAFLAQAYLDELPRALEDIANGKYSVANFRRLEVSKNGKGLGDVFTDVYLQRGAESGGIRYNLTAKGEGINITEAAISDGVVVTTSAGSTGYYSYPDKLRNDDVLEPDRFTLISEDEMGIAHILPTYTERGTTGEHPLRYTVPWGTNVELKMVRPADARLYGVGPRDGVKIGMKDRVLIKPSQNVTSVIRLGPRPSTA